MNYNTIKDALLIAGVVISNHIWDFWNPLNAAQMLMTYISVFLISAAVLWKVEDLQEEKKTDERKRPQERQL